MCVWQGNVTTRLIATSDHAVATALVTTERVFLQQLENDSSTVGGAAVRRGIKHLDYLNEHWMTIPLWQSWSEFGRIRTSSILKIPIDGVIPTTNHLESFNAILKRKHLAALLHSGHRLRFDSLIHLLITRVLPDIFKHRNLPSWLQQLAGP